MKLFFRQFGEGPPMVILHGLLGSSDNWLTQAKVFQEAYAVYLPDQRNHGRSPHSDMHDYTAMRDDLFEFFEDHQLENVILIGHSMGGKTAMSFAIKYPEKLKSLIVVDIGPKQYDVHNDEIIDAMKSISLDGIKSRNDADQALSSYIENKTVRQFVLKNLDRQDDGHYSWRVNLDVLEKNIERVSDPVVQGVFTKPTLFIHGADSKYVLDEDWPLIVKMFPAAKRVTLQTGHWVQAEDQEGFSIAVKDFLNAKP